jgi:sugar diacid utilization regulator
VWARPEVVEAVAALSESRTGVLRRMPDAGLHHRFLVAPVVWREHEWGRLAIMEHGTRFAALDLHIARRAAVSVALEMSAEHRAARGEWDARASLLGELVRGNRDLVSLARRAQYLGLDLDAGRVLCLVAAADPGAGDLPPAAEIATAFIGTTGEQVLAAGVAEGVLVALELAPDRPAREAIEDVRARVEAALRTLGSAPTMVAALSARCSSVADFLRAYSEARQVLTCLTTVADTEHARTLTADDLGPARLLLASTDRVDALRFAHDALGVVLSPAEGMGDLLETLYVFFDCSRSVRRSAQVLSLHENTIRYRLARVEELTGLAVGSNSDDQLTVQLALLILRICGEGVRRPHEAPPADVAVPA